MICFHFSIFEPLETAPAIGTFYIDALWFAFILVSLNHWKQHYEWIFKHTAVVICFHFSIFEPLETADRDNIPMLGVLWFAFILVSLNHWKQHGNCWTKTIFVVICFHFSIFEPLETAAAVSLLTSIALWFAFILVSLNHWKQHSGEKCILRGSCDLLSF